MKRTAANLEQWKQDGVVFVPNARTNQQMPMYYQFVEDYLANEERYDLQRACTELKVPALFVHGTNDQTVPFEYAEKLSNWASTGKLLAIENGNHTFGGKHPFTDEDLPEDTQITLDATIQHFKSIVQD
jgi:fermentation-respiration switch protein FrsA (DUF1100 family)